MTRRTPRQNVKRGSASYGMAFTSVLLRRLAVRTLGRLDLVAAVADPVDAAEEDGSRHDDVGDDVQDAPGQERRRRAREAGGVAELLRLRVGDQQDGGPADLLETVDVLPVPAGVGPETLAGLGDQGVPVAEGRRAGRAGRRAARLQPLLEAIGAEIALP